MDKGEEGCPGPTRGARLGEQYVNRLHYITLKYFKCHKLIETAKALGLSMLNNTS